MREERYIPGNKCACKGTGLIPLPAVLKGGNQVFCPSHPCKRYWPQLQKDGTYQFKELTREGLK
jgi:hypothetical protein